MIPVKLRLSGFLSYREPVTVDFSDFDLACISGQNGAGKSSLLDAITWALFGQARRQDDAVINGNEDVAEVSLEFEYEGSYYRVLRSKPRDKTTVLEFNLRDEAGQWKVLTEHTLNKTQERIRRTLRMDYETFTNASFFLQGKADQFAQQRPADRKRILSNILGLEIWETYKDGASARRKSLERELARIEGQLKEIEVELSEESTRRDKLEQLESRLKELSDNRITKEKYLEVQVKLAAELEHNQSRVKDLASQLQSAKQRRDQRAKQLAERRQEQEAYQSQAEHAAEIEADYQQLHVVRQELERLAQIEAKYNTLQRECSPYQAEIQSEKARLETDRDHLIKRKVEVETAEREIPGIQRDYSNARQQLDDLTKAIHTKDLLKEKIDLLSPEKARLDQERKTLLAEEAEKRERIEHLEGMPEGVCPLCGSDLTADERSVLIDRLKRELNDLVGRIHENESVSSENKKELSSVTAEFNKLSGLDQQQRQTQPRVFQLEERRKSLQKIIQDWQQNYAGKLAEAEQFLAAENYAEVARQRLIDLNQQIAAIGYDPHMHESARQRELALRSSESRLRDLEKARSALDPLTRQISDLQVELISDESEISTRQTSYDEEQKACEAKAAILPDVVALEKDLNQTKLEENQKRLEVGGARQKVAVLKDLKVRREELTAERSGNNQQIARLKTLERAFGKDGVPALLIEQALPEIVSQANTFLDRLSNGTMSVSFASQRDYKDSKREDKKETLDILISDPAGMREYEMFSGGEAFRVNFAIRLALSRVLARRAGARLQTLVIDEGFGSQDVDGRQRLIEAINLVRADFAKIIVITHLEELKDAFPARIEVEKGAFGSSVRVLLA